MAEQFGRVMPGGLITARDMNSIMERLEELERRVSTLEAGGPGGTGVVITGLIPSGPVRVLSELRVIGMSFGVPEANVVIIGNTQVTEFKPGSSDTQLTFDIPVPLVPLIFGSREVTLTVKNPQGSASTLVTLLPREGFATI